MAESRRRICIIGGGASGLVSIKNCLDENLIPICYEKSSDIGGLWNYREDLGKNQATVMASTVVNSSKEMYAFSDFPPPREWPNFTHHSLVEKYLRMYADHFQLIKHIRFNTFVVKVDKSSDYDVTGRWIVHLNDGSSEVFDAVMVCTGHHADIFVPEFEGLHNFKGRVLHSQKYRTWKEFKNQRVLVIGIGNSALDISTELSDFCPKVYLSTRRGCWIWHRVWKRGYPNDVTYISRWKELGFTGLFPFYYIQSNFEHVINKRMDAVRFNLKPKHRFWDQHPAVNDRIHVCLGKGTVILKQNVAKFTETSVIFADGTEAEIDVVIICTGYTFGFPFLDPTIIPVNDNQVSLYKYVFPPNLFHATLAVIGLIQPQGPLFPLVELQGRWATSLFNKKIYLPPKSVMEKDIEDKIKWMEKKYFRSQKHTMQVLPLPYADEIASLIGAKPNLRKFIFTDPKLAIAAYFGPCTPYNFRLNDPKTHKAARANVMSAYSRIIAPTKSRKAEPGVRFKWLAVFYKILACALLAFCMTYAFTASGLRQYVSTSRNIPFVSFVYLMFVLCYYLTCIFIYFFFEVFTDYMPLVS